MVLAISFMVIGYTVRLFEENLQPVLRYQWISEDDYNRLRKDDHKRLASRKARDSRKARRVPVDSTNTRDSMWIQ